MKKILQSSMIILSMSCIVLSKKCGKDAKQLIGKNEKMVVERMTEAELRKNTDVTEKLNEIQLALVADEDNTDNNFIINREETVCIKEKGLTSYTFPITKCHEGIEVQNLVLNYTKDGVCNVFLTTYSLNREEVLQLHNVGSLEDKMTVAIKRNTDTVSREKMFYKCNILAKVPVAWNQSGQVTSVQEWLQKQPCQDVSIIKTDRPGNTVNAPVLQILTTPVVGITFSSFLKQFKAKITTVHPNSVWWKTTASDTLICFLKRNFDPETVKLNEKANEFIIWAVPYLCKHPDVSWSLLENWFLTAAVSGDGYYDAKFWEKNNPKLPEKKLPSYSDFVKAYPKTEEDGNILNMSNSAVYDLAGGSILKNHLAGNPNYRNACAIRASRAFNYSGVPVGTMIQATGKGIDGKNYILSAKAFNRWMRKTFGKPTYQLVCPKENKKEAIAAFLKDKTGVYTVVNKSIARAGYSGHVDLITNGKCLAGANVNPKGGIDVIEIWKLK